MPRSFVASLVLITSLLPLLSHCQSGDPCPSIVDEPSCVCNHPDGSGRIDATILGNLAAEAPKFVVVDYRLIVYFDKPPKPEAIQAF